MLFSGLLLSSTGCVNRASVFAPVFLPEQETIRYDDAHIMSDEDLPSWVVDADPTLQGSASFDVRTGINSGVGIERFPSGNTGLPGPGASVNMQTIPPEGRAPRYLSLHEAIAATLGTSDVIRVSTGDGASAVGSTVYDSAIVNTGVDSARARFDPNLSIDNTFSHEEQPFLVDAVDPFITGYKVDGYQFRAGVTKGTLTGGMAEVAVNSNPMRSTDPLWAFSPRAASSLDMSYRQPLLQGAGRDVNTAPITIAILQTERSQLQLEESVQQMVRSVIQQYWTLVAARVEVWTREQQVEQSSWAYEYAEARLNRGMGDGGELAQARVTFAGHRAQLINARARLLNQEAALANLLGWPPPSDREMTPTTNFQGEPLQLAWEQDVRTAIENHPRLAAWRLALEADQQAILMAENGTLPDLSVLASYRANGLGGRADDGEWVDTTSAKYGSWLIGVDFQMPLGQRASRADYRQQQLIAARDRALYEESTHQLIHTVGRIHRNLDQYYTEYLAYKEMREAAEINLDAQTSRWENGLTIYLYVLQAIASWGDAVTAESQALLRYNMETARLYEEMGVLLEQFDIQFVQQNRSSMGPGVRFGPAHSYPARMVPVPSGAAVPAEANIPTEDRFGLQEVD
jgi:outer membrane protein TolC